MRNQVFKIGDKIMGVGMSNDPEYRRGVITGVNGRKETGFRTNAPCMSYSVSWDSGSGSMAWRDEEELQALFWAENESKLVAVAQEIVDEMEAEKK